MRILLAGDTHGNGDHIRWLVEKAVEKDADRLFVLGDFGYWEHMAEGVNFLDRCDLRAVAQEVEIYFLDGNHDKTSLLLDKYSGITDDEGFLLVRDHVRYAPRGHQWNWGGAEFIALGGAYSVDKEWRLEVEAKRTGPESQWFPEEEMTDADMARIIGDADPSKVNVMLAHDKPRSSSPRWNRKTFDECLPNQDRLERAMQALRPSTFFHGHLHFAYDDMVPLNNDGEWEGQGCQVVGLDCDPEAGGIKEKSWHLLEIESR